MVVNASTPGLRRHPCLCSPHSTASTPSRRRDYNRWLIPPAALRCTSASARSTRPACYKNSFVAHFHASQTAVGIIFSIAIVMLGLSAAVGGTWVEANGPRKAMFVAACFWATGFLVGALGIATGQLWLVYLGYGVLGGIGLGIGYISPVSTLIKWFPDRPGLATGLAIMGFGGGDVVQLGNASNQETVTVVGVNGTTLTLSCPLKFAHGAGEPIARTGGNLQYQDLELAAGRLRCLRTTASRASARTASRRSLLPASCSPRACRRRAPHRRGRRARRSTARRSSPGRQRSVRPCTRCSGARRRIRSSPSRTRRTRTRSARSCSGPRLVLPLKPGTWYYRVRGFNYAFPTGAQQMSWSDPARIVVAKPKFRVVSPASNSAPHESFAFAWV